jgi:hypothetical protein
MRRSSGEILLEKCTIDIIPSTPGRAAGTAGYFHSVSIDRIINHQWRCERKTDPSCGPTLA